MAETSGASWPIALRLALPPDLHEVRRATERIHAFLAGQRCGKEELMACDLALVEACNNAINYAPESSRRLLIAVEALCSETEIELRVGDHTAGFDWPKRATLPDSEHEQGRGVYLIQSLMDYARYFRGPNENILVMRKNRSSGAGQPPAELDATAYRSKLAEKEHVLGEVLEELGSCYESLAAIFRYSTEQSKAADLESFAQRLLGDLLRSIEGEWFVLRLAGTQEANLSVFITSKGALKLQPLPLPASGYNIASVELEAAGSRRDVWFDSVQPLDSRDPLASVSPNASGVAHPFFVRDNLVGVLAVGKTKSSTNAPAVTFTAGQMNVIGTFADFLGIQIVNARFQEEHLSNRLMARELEIASEIQQSLLSKTLPSVPGLGVAAFCRSAYQVGGDFYDVLRIDEQALLLVIADVMGKGLPAAMFAAILRPLLRAAPELVRQPASLLARVNQVLFEDLSRVDMFITVQLAYADAVAKKVVVASAGHCPLLLASGDGAAVRAISPEGMPLGILPNTNFAEEIVELAPGCSILLYTDGLTEQTNVQNERYEQKQLVEWFRRVTVGVQKADELKQALANELVAFRDNMVLNDDQTFLIVTR